MSRMECVTKVLPFWDALEKEEENFHSNRRSISNLPRDFGFMQDIHYFKVLATYKCKRECFPVATSDILVAIITPIQSSYTRKSSRPVHFLASPTSFYY